ncbi:hypothetical protein N9R79_09175 [Vibrio sp.]|nr:hypothetical protein [Vibrio sp.]
MPKSMMSLLLCLITLGGCSSSQSKGFTYDVSYNGSLGGPHIAKELYVFTDPKGLIGREFGYGSLNGAPGGSTGGGGGIPQRIMGYWMKSKDENTPNDIYYSVDQIIDLEESKAKIKAMDNYYVGGIYTSSLQVIVSFDKVYIFYQGWCNKHKHSCAINPTGDPEGYVGRGATSNAKAVTLFEGTANQSSLTPFPNTIFERWAKQDADKITLQQKLKEDPEYLEKKLAREKKQRIADKKRQDIEDEQWWQEFKKEHGIK